MDTIQHLESLQGSFVEEDQFGQEVEMYDLPKRKVLIVDDEPYNILALKIIIQQVGMPLTQLQFNQFIDSAHNG